MSIEREIGGGDDALVSWYRARFGEPLTADEAYGYWLFVASSVLAVLGVLLFLVTTRATGGRTAAYALGAVGLAGVLTGQVVGQSFDRRAKWLAYVGAALCVVAAAWFVSLYPGRWSFGQGSTNDVVTLYLVGIAVVALSGILAPVVVGQSRARAAAEAALVAAREDAAGERAGREAAEGEADGEREAREAVESEVAEEREAHEAATAAHEAAEAHLERLHDSSATFEVYEDGAGKWRWRLVHRNGNIVADSAQGYASDRNARRGMRSVRRNALGAAVIWQREADPEPEPDPVAEESKATFELYEDDAGEWRWRLRHDNGNVVAAAARGFSSKSAARDSVEGIREYVVPADYLDLDPAAFEVYEDAAGQYRWRLLHRNGNVLADSGEGYASRANARRAVDTVSGTAAEAAADADAGASFDVYEDAADEHRWRLVAANGEIIADSGEGYGSAGAAESAVERVREYAPDADTLTVGEAAIEVYEDDAGDHRWRLRHRNGTILATGAEGYSGRTAAVDGVNSVKRNAPNAPETVEGEADEAAVEE